MTPADISDAKRIADALNDNHICTGPGCRWTPFENGSVYVVLLNGSGASGVAYVPNGIISEDEYKTLAKLFTDKGMKTRGYNGPSARTKLFMENCAKNGGATPRIGGIETREEVNRDLNWLYNHLSTIRYQLAESQKAMPLPSVEQGKVARERLSASPTHRPTTQCNR